MGKKAVFYLLGALILSACGGSGKGPQESGGIAPVESDEVLLGVLQEALLNSSPSIVYPNTATTVQATSSVSSQTQSVSVGDVVLTADSISTAASSEISQTVVSSTNLQLSGVDEADLVKSSGGFLFVAVPATYYYSTVPVAVDSGFVSEVSRTYMSNRIRILRMIDNTVDSEVVTEFELGDAEDPPMTGIYLYANKQGMAQKLIAVSPGSGSTVIQVINVSDPATPVVERKVEIDGAQVATRRIDNHLYLVSRYSPRPDGYVTYAYNETMVEENERLLAEATLDEWLPDIRYDDGESKELLSASDCYLPDGEGTSNLQAELVTLSVLDLNTRSSVNSRCLVGGTEAIFVSQQAAYLATSQYGSWKDESGVLEYDDGYQTDIHKFSLEGDTTIYRGSEAVEGHLGWEQNKKSFRMGEQGRYFIVATSLGSVFGGSATTKLTVIEGSPQTGFDTVNTLPNERHPEPIGKPNEKLYSMRVMDGHAYLVTFRKVDPLYVVDLTDPADPFIAGELEIQGYSDYLHPLPNGLLLGVGKDAVLDEERGITWYQGVKLSLFDVSDWTAPREINSIVIGKRGTQSAVLSEHHAFSILPGDGEARPMRIAIPVELHDSVLSTNYSSEPWYSYGWTNTGLYLFELDTESGNPWLSQVDSMVVEVNDGSSNYSWNTTVRDRSVLTGNGAYYIHKGQVWSAGYDSLQSPNGPK